MFWGSTATVYKNWEPQESQIRSSLPLFCYFSTFKCCLCSKVDAVQDGRLGCLVSWYPVYYSIHCYLLEQIKLNTTINNNLGFYNNIWDILEAKNVCIFKNFHTGEYFMFKLVRQTINTWQQTCLTLDYRGRLTLVAVGFVFSPSL